MGSWELMIAMIICTSVVGGTLADYFKAKQLQLNKVTPKKKSDEIYEGLRTRVETLERILTDKRESLRREIDSL